MQTQTNTIGGIPSVKICDTPQEIKVTTQQEVYGKIQHCMIMNGW